MTERRVQFTATAHDHVAREQQWWLENRDYRDLFATELEEASLSAADDGKPARLVRLTDRSRARRMPLLARPFTMSSPRGSACLPADSPAHSMVANGLVAQLCYS